MARDTAPTPADVARFWSFVDRTKPAGCWLWQRGLTGDPARKGGGYGVFYTGERKWKAHRFAWWATHGDLPDTECIRHRCDVKRCCNPGHLEPGSLADNNRDRSSRGRSAIGERGGSTVYTEGQVRELRRLVSSGTSIRDAGRATGVNLNSAQTIASGRVWKHVVALVLLLALPPQAEAQSAEVLIARTFVSEEGFDGGEGWASLGAVIRWRAASHHDGDLRAATIALSPRLHGGCAVTTRRWRCDLGADLSRPAGLGATWTAPRALGRPSRRDAWEAALGAARALLMGALPDACREEPHAWGSAADVALRLRAGERWVDAGCPGRNRYGRRLVRTRAVE